MADKVTSVDSYLDAVDPERRAALEHIRALVKRLVPEVEERMSYRMPTLFYKGRALVYLTAAKKHLSFYPSSYAIDALRERLVQWTTTDHAIQFTLANPLPDALIEELVDVHRREIDTSE